MKVHDIEPGTMVATPNPNGTIKDALDWVTAVPAIVVAVGPYRIGPDGSVMDDYFETTVHVRRLSLEQTYPEWKDRQEATQGIKRALSAKAPGMPKGQSLTDEPTVDQPELVWVDEVLTTNRIIAPWDHWVKRWKERGVKAARREAIYTQNDVARRAVAEKVAAALKPSKVRPADIDSEGVWIQVRIPREAIRSKEAKAVLAIYDNLMAELDSL